MRLLLLHKIAINLIYLISKTWKINIQGEIPSQNGIIIFWHHLMLPSWKLFQNIKAYAVVSSSKDGELLVSLLKKWRFDFIRGSSNQGGKDVMQNIVSKSRNHIILMTPDGPKGPRMKMKHGAVIAAYRSNSPLFYLNVNIRKKIIFKKSWDKFELPLPFSKIDIKISKCNEFHSNMQNNELDELINIIEGKMN